MATFSIRGGLAGVNGRKAYAFRTISQRRGPGIDPLPRPGYNRIVTHLVLFGRHAGFEQPDHDPPPLPAA